MGKIIKKIMGYDKSHPKYDVANLQNSDPTPSRRVKSTNKIK